MIYVGPLVVQTVHEVAVLDSDPVCSSESTLSVSATHTHARVLSKAILRRSYKSLNGQ